MSTKKQSRSARAGITLPIGRVHRMLKKGNFAPRVGKGASVYLAATLEYLAAEIFDLATEVALQQKKLRISPRHIMFAIKNDEELDMMLTGVIISHGGVIPHINSQLLPKRTANHSQESEDS